MAEVTIKLPEGNYCTDSQKCIFLRFNKQRDCYNCAYFNKLLRGLEDPRKCKECRALDGRV